MQGQPLEVARPQAPAAWAFLSCSILQTSTWGTAEVTHSRVAQTPAPGTPFLMPHGSPRRRGCWSPGLCNPQSEAPHTHTQGRQPDPPLVSTWGQVLWGWGWQHLTPPVLESPGSSRGKTATLRQLRRSAFAEDSLKWKLPPISEAWPHQGQGHRETMSLQLHVPQVAPSPARRA